MRNRGFAWTNYDKLQRREVMFRARRSTIPIPRSTILRAPRPGNSSGLEDAPAASLLWIDILDVPVVRGRKLIVGGKLACALQKTGSDIEVVGVTNGAACPSFKKQCVGELGAASGHGEIRMTLADVSTPAAAPETYGARW